MVIEAVEVEVEVEVEVKEEDFHDKLQELRSVFQSGATFFSILNLSTHDASPWGT